MITPKEIGFHHVACEASKKGLDRGGEWDSEPNRIQWTKEGLDCLMVRNPCGLNWCGYVGVKPGHPAYEKHYDEVDVSVHGGLTYADHCGGNICHLIEEGEETPVWWLGFDCAHYRDWAPGYSNGRLEEYAHYRNQAFVEQEVNSLADQLGTGK